jgi:hypothetical protein
VIAALFCALACGVAVLTAYRGAMQSQDGALFSGFSRAGLRTPSNSAFGLWFVLPVLAQAYLLNLAFAAPQFSRAGRWALSAVAAATVLLAGPQVVSAVWECGGRALVYGTLGYTFLP